MTRISIDISEQQRKKIRVLAAFYDMTIKDFIIDRTIGSTPNEETIKSFDDYKNNVGLTKHNDFDEFWDDLNK